MARKKNGSEISVVHLPNFYAYVFLWCLLNFISWVYLAMLIFLVEYSKKLQEFPGVLVVRTLSSNVGGMGSIPGLGTKIPHTVGCYQKVKKKTYAYPQFPS